MKDRHPRGTAADTLTFVCLYMHALFVSFVWLCFDRPRPPNATSPIMFKSHTPFAPSLGSPSLLPEDTCMLVLLVRNPIDNQAAWKRYVSCMLHRRYTEQQHQCLSWKPTSWMSRDVFSYEVGTGRCNQVRTVPFWWAHPTGRRWCRGFEALASDAPLEGSHRDVPI